MTTTCEGESDDLQLVTFLLSFTKYKQNFRSNQAVLFICFIAALGLNFKSSYFLTLIVTISMPVIL